MSGYVEHKGVLSQLIRDARRNKEDFVVARRNKEDFVLWPTLMGPYFINS